MITQSAVSYVFMAEYTGVLVRVFKIFAVGAKCPAVAFRRLLQILVTTQAAGVVDVFLSALAVTVPVDIVWILGQLHKGVHQPMLTLHQQVMQRIALWNMTLGAGGAKANRVVATVDILTVSGAHWLEGVAAGAEFVIPGHVDTGIYNRPGADSDNPQSTETNKNQKPASVKEFHYD